jgi:U4/U6.U5 tri-snRNP-associated protein 2
LQGELEVIKEVYRKHIMEKREDGDELNGEAGSVIGTWDGIVTKTPKVPVLMLDLDLPPPPLF